LSSELKLWKSRLEEGNAAYSDRRYSKAEIRFCEALKQAESWPRDLMGDEQRDVDSSLSKSLNNLAALYHSQGKYTLAEELYLRSLEIKKSLLGEEDIEVALNLQNLGACYCARHKYIEAEELFKRSLAIREKILGAEHPELLTTLRNYSVLLRKLKREEEAQVLEKRVLQVEQGKVSQ
jgi:tetratricopeptide (TPR) repeat protein